MQSFQKWNSHDLRPFLKKGPAFFYDLDYLKTHAAHMQSTSQHISHGDLKLWFAVKANPLSFIIDTLKENQFHFDVASLGELSQIMKVGVPGDRILVTGPGKSEEFLNLAFHHRVGTIVLESVEQWRKIIPLSKETGHYPSLLIRLQIQWEQGEKSILGGSDITPFGMEAGDAKIVLQELVGTKFSFLGFHVFQWGNILSATKLHSIWKQTFQFCINLQPQFQVLDVGGGLGIPYDPSVSSLDWESSIYPLQELKTKFKIPQIWMELGRYAVGECGIYATKIIERKQVYGKEILVLEGGINHLARPALIDQYFPVSVYDPHFHFDLTKPLKKYSLHGPLCTALDFLGDHELPATLAPGDILIFHQCGAYGFTESMPYFLAHPTPGEVILQNEKLKMVREQKLANEWLV
ncbi:MAG: hypothetical protein QE271_04505 [Bacteriovoracaceae bacterium]|nr:hypothetical protein [Bacteriovoracaceae bacterium]